MLREGMTRLEAAQVWVNDFNAVSNQMIAKLMQADLDDWCEVTRPVVGDRVWRAKAKLLRFTARLSARSS